MWVSHIGGLSVMADNPGMGPMSDAAPDSRSHSPSPRAGADPLTRRRRLTAVAELGGLDRIGDPVLVSLTRLAQSVTGAASAAIHIFDDQYQRRVAASGAPLVDHPARDSLCRLVVEDGTRIVSCDAAAEPRLAYSSFVLGDAPVRFYASLPLTIGGELTVGTLCAFDTVPRALSDDQLERLEDIAGLALAHLTLLRIASDLSHEATVDSLTGATTRVVFEDRVARELARHRETGGDVLVAVIDLDDFKTINDTYGHDRGDAALRWVTDGLRVAVGPDGTVGRLGGDEFAILRRLDVCRVDAQLAAIRSAAAGFAPAFRLSVGATLARPGDDVPALLRRADQLMYADKAGGRAARPVLGATPAS
jgi:diguanylate cyclase (GGDEF)-like protein